MELCNSLFREEGYHLQFQCSAGIFLIQWPHVKDTTMKRKCEEKRDKA